MTKMILILGAGAPRGLGGALARRFAGKGHHIIVSGRTRSKVQQIADEVAGTGAAIEAMQVDVTVAADQDRLFARAKEIGPLGAVLYNAGNNAIIPFEELTADLFEDYWRVGCFGAFLTAQRTMPVLREQGGRQPYLYRGFRVIARECQFRTFCRGESGLAQSCPVACPGVWAARGACCTCDY